MEQSEIRAMLNYPDSALVAHAVERANLSAVEWQIVNMREHGSYTVERAAEKLDVSTGTVKNRYRSGMDKLDKCWGSIPWINTIIKS